MSLMTTEEAINRISKVLKGNMLDAEDEQAVALAIDALKKQLPVVPEYTILKYRMDDCLLEVKHPECPTCRNRGLVLWDASANKDNDYCPRCGQKFDWENYEG